MSGAVSAQYPTGCDTCGAVVGDPCRSLTTGRVTDTHKARIDAQATQDTPAGVLLVALANAVAAARRDRRR